MRLAVLPKARCVDTAKPHTDTPSLGVLSALLYISAQHTEARTSATTETAAAHAAEFQHTEGGSNP